LVTTHVFDRILGLNEAAERAGLSAPRLRQLIDAGQLPAKKIGATWLVLAEDVELLANGSRRGQPGRPPSPLAGNWALEDEPLAEQQWLVNNAAAVVAEPLTEGSEHGYRLIFTDVRGGAPKLVDLETQRDVAEFWRWIVVAIDDWAQRVEHSRGFRVDRTWPVEPPSAGVEVASVDPDWPSVWTKGDLRAAAPIDVEEARGLFRNDRQRLTAWVLPAMAARIQGRLWKMVDDPALNAIIETRDRTDPNRRQGVGVLICERSEDVTLGSAFKEALRRFQCRSGYVVTIEMPTEADLGLARSVGDVWFEAMDHLIRSVRA
jgi:excisionase family DNA binding protein